MEGVLESSGSESQWRWQFALFRFVAGLVTDDHRAQLGSDAYYHTLLCEGVRPPPINSTPSTLQDQGSSTGRCPLVCGLQQTAKQPASCTLP